MRLSFSYGHEEGPRVSGVGWGHNDAVPSSYSHACSSADGRRQAVVLLNGEPSSQRQEHAVNRALAEAFHS